MMYDVDITRLDISALFDLQGPQAALSDWTAGALPPWPGTPNSRNTTGTRCLVWLGVNRWILRAPISEEVSLVHELRPTEAPEEISIVMISDALAFWRISGPDAAQIIAIASPLDVHPTVFGKTGATWTEAFGQRALILRVAGGFEIGIDRSYAAMIEDYFAKINS